MLVVLYINLSVNNLNFYWLISHKDDGYELLKEGNRIACGDSEKIENSQNVDEAGCKNKCDADENCNYLWYRSTNQKCMLYSSCNTLIDNPLANGKLFKKKLDWN